MSSAQHAAQGIKDLAALFVRRPVLALVINLLIVVAGLAAFRGVEVRELPEVDLPEGLYHLRAARTLLELGQIKEAEQHFQRAVHREPQLSDAVHGLGLCAEERGDRKAMIKHWLEVRERDLVEPAVP